MSALSSFTPLDFYAILYDIANSMQIVTDGNGSEVECARLQTVAVTKDYAAEVKTANLGKDSRYNGKKIFFSRASPTDAQGGTEARFNFPALFLGEQDESYSRAGSQYSIDYSIALSDRIEQAQGSNFNQSLCAQRTYEEVAQGLRALWQQVYATLSDYVYADLYNGGSILRSGWYSVAGLQQLLALTAITSYEEVAYLNQYISETTKAYIAFDMHTESAISYFLNINVQFFGCVAPIAARPQEEPIIPINPYDDDAVLYFAAIEATGATLSDTTKDATNEAIVALKDAGLWLKAYALYFIIGGTAAAHKFNAKNPLDTNAAYRLTFAGGWVHSSTGATPNGTNAFADTFFVPSLNAAVSSITLAYYSRSSATGSYIEMGASGSAISSGQGQLFIAPNISGTGFNAVNATGNAPFAGTPTNAMYIASRTDAVNFRIHRNATLLATNNQPNTASNKNIYIGARNNNGTTDAFSARQCAFSAILSGLTTPEANTFYAIVETFQTALGRNN